MAVKKKASGKSATSKTTTKKTAAKKTTASKSAGATAKKKAPAKKRTPAKKKEKPPVVLKLYWGVFNQSAKRVDVFPFDKKKDAQKKAKELAKSTDTPHFVQRVKEAVE